MNLGINQINNSSSISFEARKVKYSKPNSYSGHALKGDFQPGCYPKKNNVFIAFWHALKRTFSDL